jgi:hypothetical protein
LPRIQRAPLHPLDQFRAFLTLREKGKSEEEIAAAFFVSVAVVRQRLRLASVSPKLLGIVIFPGSGVTDNLADKARKLGIPLFDFRKRGGA